MEMKKSDPASQDGPEQKRSHFNGDMTSFDRQIVTSRQSSIPCSLPALEHESFGIGCTVADFIDDIETR